ncbi:MAG: peptidase S41 [Rhodospirillaceae bacterium]|nr:peptidase S41 [Rhodospirillaceae bacterium]
MKKNLTLLVTIALTSFYFSIALAQDETSKQKNENTYQLLNLFGDVFERVRATYVEEITDEQLIESAITGMLTSLDPHSSYLNAKNFKDMQVQTRGKFGGLGIEVTMENGLVRVVSPIDDTPAFRSGVKAGDLISHLDGKAVQGLTLAQAVELMRGKVGTDIKLTIRRVGAEPFEVNITRAVIPIRTVRSRIEGDIGYVRISSFSALTGTGLKQAMKKLNAELGDKMKGLVLDLRNNPGGLLDQAIAVSDTFMDQGEIVSTRTREKQDYTRFNARKGDLSNGKPIVVLVNGGSASASEIVAGALQDHKRAIVLGTKSFGKGSVQTIIPLSGRGAMRLTTALYYTPSGRSIQKVGIKPDIVVEQARVESLAQRGLLRREVDLRGALNNGNGPEKKSTSPSDSPTSKGESQPSDQAKQANRQDFQLQRALDLLRGVYFFNSNIETDKG